MGFDQEMRTEMVVDIFDWCLLEFWGLYDLTMVLWIYWLQWCTWYLILVLKAIYACVALHMICWWVDLWLSYMFSLKIGVTCYFFFPWYFLICSDYLFKLLLIGDSGVGKSCLLLRFAVSLKSPFVPFL